MIQTVLFVFGALNAIAGVFIAFFSFGARSTDEVVFGVSLGSGAFVAGILLIGFGKALQLLEQIAANTSPPRVPAAADDPRAGNHTLAAAVRRDEYAGRRYSVHGDGTVLSVMGDSQFTWRTEGEFRSWADKNPVR